MLPYVSILLGYNFTNVASMSLQIQQLESKMLVYSNLQKIAVPTTG